MSTILEMNQFSLNDLKRVFHYDLREFMISLSLEKKTFCDDLDNNSWIFQGMNCSELEKRPIVVLAWFTENIYEDCIYFLKKYFL